MPPTDRALKCPECGCRMREYGPKQRRKLGRRWICPVGWGYTYPTFKTTDNKDHTRFYHVYSECELRGPDDSEY